MIDTKIKGLNKTINNLRAKSKEVSKNVDNELKKSALFIETDAKSRVPVDTGRLKSGIKTRAIDKGQEVFVDVDYAPYVEFGTITRVQIPKGLEAYASQFKGKGILKTGGLPARPYLFPAFEAERKKLLKRLQNVSK